MFGLISKKKLKKEVKDLKAENRARNMGQNYEPPISDEQKKKNLYLQGHEDGTDNACNWLMSKFKL